MNFYEETWQRSLQLHKKKEIATDWMWSYLTLLSSASALFQVYSSRTSLGPETITTDDADEVNHQLVSLVVIEMQQTLLL